MCTARYRSSCAGLSLRERQTDWGVQNFRGTRCARNVSSATGTSSPGKLRRRLDRYEASDKLRRPVMPGWRSRGPPPRLRTTGYASVTPKAAVLILLLQLQTGGNYRISFVSFIFRSLFIFSFGSRVVD